MDTDSAKQEAKPLVFRDPAHNPPRADPELDERTRLLLDRFVSEGFRVEVRHPGKSNLWSIKLSNAEQTWEREVARRTIKSAAIEHLDSKEQLVRHAKESTSAPSSPRWKLVDSRRRYRLR